MNVLIESSGRDIAVYDMVERLFPVSSGYRRLAVHFDISSLRFAQLSVEKRMARELAAGAMALGDPAAVVEANAGGPYGASVLAAVEATSREVWRNVCGRGRPGWHLASLRITTSRCSPWRVGAVGGSQFDIVRR